MKILKNILSTADNTKIIKYLLKIDKWMVAYDNAPRDKQIVIEYGGVLVTRSRHMSWEELNETFKKFQGMSLTSYNTDIESDTDPYLNDWGRKIATIVCKKAGIKKYKINRFYWNFYRPSDATHWHLDKSISGYRSFVYNLHDSDGGTQIGKKIYRDKASEAKLFPSDTSHRGVGPKKFNFRLNLNCILQLL